MTEPSFEFEIVVVGAGPAGLAAACAAAESGARVAVLEAVPWLGGQIWRGHSAAAMDDPKPGKKPSAANRQSRGWLERFAKSGAKLLERTSVIAAPETGVLLAEHNEVPCQIHWQRLILATGARELFLPFPGWTLPNVMGPGGLLALAKDGWPVRGQRVVVAGSGPLLLAAAEGLSRHGARIVAMAEQAPWRKLLNFGMGLWTRPLKLWQAAQFELRLLGVPYRCGTWIARAQGDDRVRDVTLTDSRRTWTEECDLLACAFGLVPNLELPLALGCELDNNFVRVDSFQATTSANVYCAGEPTGIGGADCALVQGEIAGYSAAGKPDRAELLFRRRASWHHFRDALALTFALRPELKTLATDDTLVCRCEDVTLGQMRRFSDWRDGKLQSRCGMGACQGRICGAAARVLLGWGMDSVRPPLAPARVGSLICPSPLQG
jgi:NADPH-dependent 2,4-dienoyl-CoA reductase/sulfur reductase-like enzyme